MVVVVLHLHVVDLVAVVVVPQMLGLLQVLVHTSMPRHPLLALVLFVALVVVAAVPAA